MSIRFLDSFRFLSAGLASLVNNLNEFPEMTKVFPDPCTRSLLLRKGVYPYSYINSLEVLNETCLPPIEDFLNELTEENITYDDYNHAISVWDAFNVNTIIEYTELYMKTDIILLCDVFEQYRKISMRQYELDPCWSYTSPGYFWSAMLKKTGVELQILKDIDMIQFIESGTRGGITQCVLRNARANNPKVPGYKDSDPNSYLLYADVNNLYGWAMLQNLPYGEFKWMEKVDSFDFLSVDRDSDYGYVLEVDISYPDHLHDSHRDFPFFAESRVPPISKGGVKKLLLTLEDKSRYVTHYINLQQAVREGLIVTKIYRVLQFRQSKWLADYINFNTSLRAMATSEFEKDYYKLGNNAVFDRSMMNVRNRMDIKVTTSEERFLKLVRRPNFNDRFIYENDLIAVKMDRKIVTFDQPIYVGFTILELSKELMYRYHYNEFIPRYGSNIQLCYMDTDSFIYLIHCHDLYSDLKEMEKLFDFSSYPRSHPCYSPDNKKVVGLLKDELSSVPMHELVALRPKIYAFKADSLDVTRVKGIKKSFIKHHITFSDLKNTLITGDDTYADFKNIGSNMHSVYTYMHHKKALSFYDDKRIILPDGVRTIPYGHKDVLNLYPELNIKH